MWEGMNRNSLREELVEKVQDLHKRYNENGSRQIGVESEEITMRANYSVKEKYKEKRGKTDGIERINRDEQRYERRGEREKTDIMVKIWEWRRGEFVLAEERREGVQEREKYYNIWVKNAKR